MFKGVIDKLQQFITINILVNEGGDDYVPQKDVFVSA